MPYGMIWLQYTCICIACTKQFQQQTSTFNYLILLCASCPYNTKAYGSSIAMLFLGAWHSAVLHFIKINQCYHILIINGNVLLPHSRQIQCEFLHVQPTHSSDALQKLPSLWNTCIYRNACHTFVTSTVNITKHMYHSMPFMVVKKSTKQICFYLN